MFQALKGWWQKKRDRQKRIEQWKSGFQRINGRPVKFAELGQYHDDILSGRPAPDLNPRRPQPPRDPRTPKALADWEDNLAIIWAGTAATVEFTYTDRHGEHSRRKVDPQQLSLDHHNRLILIGHCHLRDERRTFTEYSIDTKIKVGNKRYDSLHEWAEEVLNIDLSHLFETV